jgi:hypothetical protein
MLDEFRDGVVTALCFTLDLGGISRGMELIA